MKTLFEHLIEGRIPASFVHQDEVCVAFMDIRPFGRGHVLVAPRLPRALMAQLDPATRAHLWEIASRVAQAQQTALGSVAQHFLVNDGREASQSVPHVHIHVIPRYPGDGFATVLRMMRHVAAVVALGPPKERPGQREALEQQARTIAAAMTQLV